MEAPLFFFAGVAVVVLPCLFAVWITRSWRP